MKKYFLIFLIFSALLKAETVVVDKNAICTPIGCYGACKSGDYIETSISDAVDLANSNTNITSIEICAGEYDENRLKIKRSNLTITSASGKRDVSIVSNSNNNIFYTTSYYSNLTFSHLTLDQKENRSDFYFYEGDNYTFDDLNMTSARYAIYFKSYAQNIAINDSSVNTSSYGIYFKKSVWNDVNLSDVNITTSDYDALHFNDDVGNLNIKNTYINTTNGGDYGIYVNGNINVINFNNLTVDSNKDAFHVEKSVYQSFIINGSVFNSGSSYSGINFQGDIDNGGSLNSVSIQAGFRGVNFDSNAYGDINITDSNISTDSDTAVRLGGSGGDFNLSDCKINSTNGYGLYFSGAIDKIDFENSKISAYNDGAHFEGNINSGTVFKHNCLKSYNGYALNFQGDVYNPVTVENNCFYADAGTSYLAYSKYETISADQNYWDGVEGSYNQNNIVDNNPWSECLNSCEITNTLPTPLIDYKMDECSWDNESGTYEINNSGSLGSDYNATAGNDANVTEGKICNGGDINSTDTEDKYILPKNDIPLPNSYTLNVWVKFPLNIQGHKPFVVTSYNGWGRRSTTSSTTYYYFNIADRPGSDYDYIYFSYDETDNEWYLCVSDNNNYDCQSFNPNSYSGWHMLTFNVDSNNKQTKFYIDTEEKLTFSAYPTGNLGLLFNSDYGSNTDNQSNGQSIGSDADEFEIYNGLLSDNEIQDLYNNQNNSSRECPICGLNSSQTNSTFNAVDYMDLTQCNAVKDWDDNITTKFVNKEFNLTVLAKDPNTDTPMEANITKVTLYYYNSSSNGKCSGDVVASKVICENCGKTNTNGCMTLDDSGLNIDRAVKCIEVNIQGKAVNNILSDVNESNSTDNFAVRPVKYTITYIPDSVKAGNDFNVTIRAVDENGNPVKDYNETVYVNSQSVDLEYNETKQGCKTGVLKKVSGGYFKNGEANITLNYNEVGDVNLSFKEVNGSEFARVDSDDTPDSQRFISLVSDTLNFTVDHFKLSAVFQNFDKEGNFTYYDRDMNISSLLELNITAVDKNGNVLSNYNKKCYAKDVTVNLQHNKIDVNVSKIIFKYKDTNGTEYDGNVSKEKNVTFIYDKNNFTTDNNGSTEVSVYFNFDRNSSVPVNPLEFNITKIDVNDTDANGSLNFGKTVKYYYGNLLLSDVLAVDNEFNKTYPFIIYDSNTSLNPGTKELVYNWYFNDKHNEIDGNVSDSEIVVAGDFNASDKISGVSVNVLSVKDGEITFKINRSDSDVNYAVVHLLSPALKWLWYSKFNEKYDISDNSTCLNHFCFALSWQQSDNKGEIGSGEFNGTEANVTDTNSTKRGVKIFR